MTDAFMMFHLNLAYSSISEDNRKKVIEKCYFPLLELIQNTHIPIGIEATAWTLNQIHSIYPDWIAIFKKLLSENKTELIGSGYTQLIGPLVPFEVNQWNQQIGLNDYKRILNTKPKLVLINEMAYSTGLVEVYEQAGYEGIIMDRDNVRLALALEYQADDQLPTHALGLNNASLPVLWSDSILFQKLQRYVHGDSRLIDYLTLFHKRAATFQRPLAVYCNDAEIFDYRPGRYKEEGELHREGEWSRLEKLLRILTQEENVNWMLPSDALKKTLSIFPENKKVLSSIRQPIPVKKQAKYNISRWAITGKNDLWINTFCHRFYRAIREKNTEIERRTVCELWASDLRTHIEKKRWEKVCDDINQLIEQYSINKIDIAQSASNENNHQTALKQYKISRDEENMILTVQSEKIILQLNLRKGLTIHSLAFATHAFKPIVGTLPHGYYDSIQLGADFYSIGTVMELPSQHKRLTDFERVEPIITECGTQLSIAGKIKTEKGMIEKCYLISLENESISFSVNFPNWHRESCILRAGTLTFFPEAFSSTVTVTTCNGGSSFETFALNQPCDHTAPASTLVSCTTGFGATTGHILIGDDNRKLSIQWNPAKAAIFPMIQHEKMGDHALLRLFFSLCELDETTHSGGHFLPIDVTLQPAVEN